MYSPIQRSISSSSPWKEKILQIIYYFQLKIYYLYLTPLADFKTRDKILDYPNTLTPQKINVK